MLKKLSPSFNLFEPCLAAPIVETQLAFLLLLHLALRRAKVCLPQSDVAVPHICILVSLLTVCVEVQFDLVRSPPVLGDHRLGPQLLHRGRVVDHLILLGRKLVEDGVVGDVGGGSFILKS